MIAPGRPDPKKAVDLQLEVEAPRQAQVGGLATYRITVRNDGPQVAEDVAIEVEFPPPLALPGRHGSRVRQSLGRLLPGEQKRVALTLTSSRPGAAACQFRVLTGLTERVWKSVSVDFVDRRLGLKIVGPAQRTAGSRAEFLFKLQNVSTIELQGLLAEVTYDAALQPREASSGVIQGSGRLTWKLGRLAPQEGVQLQVEFACPFPAENARVGLTVSGNNVPRDEQETYLQIAPLTGLLHLHVSDQEDPIRVGETTEFVVTVLNRGLQPLRQVTVTMVIPPGLQFTSASSRLGRQPLALRHDWDGSKLTFSPQTVLPPDRPLTLRIRVRALRSGDTTLAAQVTCATQPDPLTVEETLTINP
ncbi:MAG TPA: DUF11 domain-containing protein [Planctomycetaceae bacterium]|nr:DUF11 domain-containing protein [Planctomycetaceae bacterium]